MDAALYPSTRAFIGRCYNIVSRAIVIVIAWAVFVAIAVVSNFLVEYLLNTVDAPDAIRNLLSPVSYLIPMAIAFAMALSSLFDIFKLTAAGLKPSDDNEAGSSNER